MRPLIICRSSKTKYMVEVAKTLKEMGAADKLYAYVAYYEEWDRYVRDREDFVFDGIFGTKEIFENINNDPVDLKEVERIEKEYGAEESLWGLILTERWLVASAAYPLFAHVPFYSKAQKLQYFVRLIRQAEKIFDENDIDCLIDFANIGLFRLALDVVARKRGIPYYHTDGALVKDLGGKGDRFFISRRINENYSFLDKDYAHYKKNPVEIKEGHEYLKAFRENPSGSVYSLWHGSNDLSQKISWELIKSKMRGAAFEIVRFGKGVLRDTKLYSRAMQERGVRYNFSLYKSNTLSVLMRNIQGFCRFFYSRYIFQAHKEPLQNKYVFMTLHYQPEASTALMAPFENNQLAVIENIAKALPLDYQLMVKFNKMMIRRDPIAFIRYLDKLPNVHFVDHYANTRHFIEKSACVIAITGTSGFEGALMGKKTILLGDRTMPWNRIAAVTQVKNWHDLHDAVKCCETYKCDDDDLVAYLQAVHDHSFTMKNNYAWYGEFDPSNPDCDEVVKAIACEINRVHETAKKSKSTKAA
jgi:hypothetical protein